MSKEEIKIIKEEGDEVSQLTCEVCNSNDFLMLFNVEKLKKAVDEKVFLGFRESKKIKCAVCGALMKIGTDS